jgi:hypothetical protein
VIDARFGGFALRTPIHSARAALYRPSIFCNAPSVVIIVLVLAGWAVASVVVAALASIVFRGAQLRTGTITLPPDRIVLTAPDLRSVRGSSKQPDTDIAR